MALSFRSNFIFDKLVDSNTEAVENIFHNNVIYKQIDIIYFAHKEQIVAIDSLQ